VTKNKKINKTKQYPLYIIGAGPGDSGLITVKGAKILQEADVIIYDYLVSEDLLKYASKNCETICADTIKRDKRYADGFSSRVELITKLLLKKIKEGKKVVRLKNGDPMIFARFNEEIEPLVKNKIDFRIVPGVTAATAACAYAGIPLTSRGISSSIVITTGHESEEKSSGKVDWQKVSLLDTIVIYMGIENLSYIVEQLIVNGKSKDTPVAVVSSATTINQKLVIGKLKDIVKKVREHNCPAPAVIIIGEVVKKSKTYNWFKKTKKFLYTGLSEERFFEKEMFLHLPVIEIKPLANYSRLKKMIENIKHFDWLVFTSRFGVKYFFEQLFKKYDTRILSHLKIAAIGQSTAKKLKEFGIIADLVPKEETSNGLVYEFSKLKNNDGEKILLPRSDIADKGLTKNLTKLGFKVYPVVVYHNVIPKNLPMIDFKTQEVVDGIIFSSPSTVKHFVKQYGLPPSNLKIKTIGPVTKNAYDQICCFKKN
jgi:uroporphyrinogen III methyltransferase/synthase